MNYTLIIVSILAIGFIAYIVTSKDKKETVLPIEEDVKPDKFKESNLNEYWLVDIGITGKGLSILVIDWNYEKLSEKIARILKYKFYKIAHPAPHHASIIVYIPTDKKDGKGHDGSYICISSSRCCR